MSVFSIPLSAHLVGEMILRSDGHIDVPDVIEHLLEDYLERTKGDPMIWSNSHAEAVAEEEADDTVVRIGSRLRGYFWQNVFLPNGTTLRVTYKGRKYFAEIRHQQVYYEEKPCSPSQYVRRVANNTSRNAWHDIWVKRPSDREWVFSDLLRNERRIN